ncbi:glycine receptor subunit alpha-3-like isoform X1 [Acropora muricata]|uniref:glycine receptor subunit alpha-3-like isoform X1 n=2 Tax=Acropora muricata TaxID=159855 RepID=UPI0034E5493B
MFTAGKLTFLFLLFFALQEHILQTACEEVEHNESKHSEHHNRFDRRIEAPNKTLILNNLFKGYDKRLSPHYREKPVLVSLHAVIDSFHDIKEEEMEYKVEVVLKETWNDPRLAYGNSSWFVRLKGSTLAKVWYPDTLIENSRKHDVDDKTRTAYLFGDGTIFLSEWIKATLTTHMEFHRYPMDVQTLRMQIAGYSYDDSQVKYEWSSVKLREKDMTEFYVDKESLKVESTMFITGTGTHTAVVAEFQIRRRLQHFIMGFYLPCITCTCASWIQFWMEPRDIAGRASVGTATVLAEIFLLEFSNQGMPKVSYVKAAELFMVVSFTFIFSALVESAVVFKFCDVFRKRKMEDSEGDLDKCTSECGQGNKSVNKTFTTAVLSPTLSEESNKESSVCDEAVNRSMEAILPSQSEHAWKQPCFDAEQSAQTTKSLGSKIDDGARLCFPLSYAIFTVLYFGLTLYLRP